MKNLSKLIKEEIKMTKWGGLKPARRLDADIKDVLDYEQGKVKLYVSGLHHYFAGNGRKKTHGPKQLARLVR